MSLYVQYLKRSTQIHPTSFHNGVVLIAYSRVDNGYKMVARDTTKEKERLVRYHIFSSLFLSFLSFLYLLFLYRVLRRHPWQVAKQYGKNMIEHDGKAMERDVQTTCRRFQCVQSNANIWYLSLLYARCSCCSCCSCCLFSFAYSITARKDEHAPNRPVYLSPEEEKYRPYT